MLFLAQSFLPWLVASFAGGVATGAVTATADGPRRSMKWLAAAAVLAALAVAAAWLQLLPGRAGFLLDTALLFLGCYIVGCPLGAWLRGLAGDAPAAGDVAPTQVAAVAAPPLPAAGDAGGLRLTLSQGRLAIHGGPTGGGEAALRSAATVALPGCRIDMLDHSAGDALSPAQEAFIFACLARLSKAEVSVVSGRLTLEGTARSRADHAVASAMLVRAPAGLTVARAVVAVPDPALPTAAAAPQAHGQPPGSPPGLAAPEGGKADDLKRISGIGRQNEGRLHGLGIWHFSQIAAWTPDEVRWVGAYLAFPGRIEREDWVGQAKVLAAGGETAFAQRAARGDVATSKDDGSAGQGNIAETVQRRPRPPKKSPGA